MPYLARIPSTGKSSSCFPTKAALVPDFSTRLAQNVMKWPWYGNFPSGFFKATRWTSSPALRLRNKDVDKVLVSEYSSLPAVDTIRPALNSLPIPPEGPPYDALPLQSTSSRSLTAWTRTISNCEFEIWDKTSRVLFLIWDISKSPYLLAPSWQLPRQLVLAFVLLSRISRMSQHWFSLSTRTLLKTI